ncbi:MAG: rhomboid family intramembrane serine protease [Pseudomonadales bacterium]|nr:rhomboid family intramembrane serine protease [Pseudomonadales bacterium]
MSITISIILIIILVFICMLANGAGFWHTNNAIQLLWGANFGPATQDGEWWRLGSAIFLHFGVIHLGLNCIALWDVGSYLERILGHFRTLLIFIICGLAGNLFSLVYHSGTVVSGGASGAIFGMYGALVSCLWLYRDLKSFSHYKWVLVGAIGFALLTILFGLLVEGIDNAAHVGGWLVGILFGIALAPGKKGVENLAVKRAVACSLCAGLIGYGIHQLSDPPYLWSEERYLRQEIKNFIVADESLSRNWNMLLVNAKEENVPFEQLAGEIETEIVEPYTSSFEKLSEISPDAGLPSSDVLVQLQSYAKNKQQLSQKMVESLRARDPQRFNQVMQELRKPQQNRRKMPD